MDTAPDGQTGIVVTTKFIFVAFLLYFFKPTLVLDGGQPVRCSWGETFIPVAPGRHVVRCYVPYLWFRTMGDSSQEIVVGPGQVVRAQWRAPWLTLLAGKWSFPQLAGAPAGALPAPPPGGPAPSATGWQAPPSGWQPPPPGGPAPSATGWQPTPPGWQPTPPGGPAPPPGGPAPPSGWQPPPAGGPAPPSGWQPPPPGGPAPPSGWQPPPAGGPAPPPGGPAPAAAGWQAPATGWQAAPTAEWQTAPRPETRPGTAPAASDPEQPDDQAG